MQLWLKERLDWLDSVKNNWRKSQGEDELDAWLSVLRSTKPLSVLEIGNKTGSHLYCMAGCLAPGGCADGIDLAPKAEDLSVVKAKLEAEGVKAYFVTGDSKDVRTSKGLREYYDAIYVDAAHDYASALRDVKNSLMMLSVSGKYGVLGFHDTHLKPENDNYCARFWQHYKRAAPLSVMEFGKLPNQWGTGVAVYRDRLLFMVNGGLGDAAELTRTLLVASRLGYVVHVLPISGGCRNMIPIWDSTPWIQVVTKEEAARFPYRAVLCSTRRDTLEQRAAGLNYVELINGNPGAVSIVENNQRLLAALGHDPDFLNTVLEDVSGVLSQYLVPEKSSKGPPQTPNLILVAPGIGGRNIEKAKEDSKDDKRYDKWPEVIGYLPRPVTLIGDAAAEEDWSRAWVTNPPDDMCKSLIGKTPSILDIVKLFGSSAAVFCVDNGIGHLARLYNVPTVSVFNGATDPSRFAPPGARVVTEHLDRPGFIAAELHEIITGGSVPIQIPGDKGPLLSVIITCCNEGDEVYLTCADVLKKAGCRVEVIVVDDNSKDKSCDVLPEGVKLIRRPEKHGVASSRNLGVENASGDAFMFLDAHERVASGTPALLLNKAIETGAIVVSGVAPLYNSSRGAMYSCQWSFKNGRLSSEWHDRGRSDWTEKPTQSFVAPGWCVSRKSWDVMGPWPSCLSNWGSTEVCKGLQAHMCGVPIITVREAVTWHRFRGRFPYSVQSHEVWKNAFYVARVMFGEKIFTEKFLVPMKRNYPNPAVDQWLKSPELLQCSEEFDKRRTADPEALYNQWFPKGLKSEKDLQLEQALKVDTTPSNAEIVKAVEAAKPCSTCGKKAKTSLPVTPVPAALPRSSAAPAGVLTVKYAPGIRGRDIQAALKYLGKAEVLIQEGAAKDPVRKWLILGYILEAGHEVAQLEPDLYRLIMRLSPMIETDKLPEGFKLTGLMNVLISHIPLGKDKKA